LPKATASAIATSAAAPGRKAGLKLRFPSMYRLVFSPVTLRRCSLSR
jgi:hypothetical protein